VGRPERTAGPPAKREPVVSTENFYASSLTEGERVELPMAEQVENLGDEIAALRVRLKTGAEGAPGGLRVARARDRNADAGGGDAVPPVATGEQGPI
jgi:hypothetical protein